MASSLARRVFQSRLLFRPNQSDSDTLDHGVAKFLTGGYYYQSHSEVARERRDRKRSFRESFVKIAGCDLCKQVSSNRSRGREKAPFFNLALQPLSDAIDRFRASSRSTKQNGCCILAKKLLDFIDELKPVPSLLTLAG
jgi:hypothetical protein